MKDERCATCRYQEELVCHRYPPSTAVAFPPVLADQWCGEWDPKPRREVPIHVFPRRNAPEYDGEVA